MLSLHLRKPGCEVFGFIEPAASLILGSNVKLQLKVLLTPHSISTSCAGVSAFRFDMAAFLLLDLHFSKSRNCIKRFDRRRKYFFEC